MTNYDKIKSILEYGHWAQVELENSLIVLFVYHPEDSDLILSDLGIYWDEEKINKRQVSSITPIPHRPKLFKVGDKVDILEIAKECKRYRDWSETPKEMIGQKGLEIKSITTDNDFGIYYGVFQKDKEDYWMFPAYCVAPHFEESEGEIETIKIDDLEYSKAEVRERIKELKPIKS